MERLYPDWNTLNSLHAPLTEGERALVEFLDSSLPDAWRVFVQPHLNGLRPDVVVVNPNVGAVVFEVKDWHLGNYRAEGDRLIGRTAHGEWEEQNPLLQARTYAAQIYEQFLIGQEAVGDPTNDHRTQRHCRAAVYFHRATTDDAAALLRPWKNTDDIVFGRDWLNKQRLQQIVPSCYHTRREGVDDFLTEMLGRLILHLLPPHHYIEQNSPLPMPDRHQRIHAAPRSGFHRIRGPVGSGKSLTLVHRALQANHEGRNVLLTCHNITMAHWLHDLLQRSPYKVHKNRQTCKHFHDWCIAQAVQGGVLRRLPCKQNPSTASSDPFGPEEREAEAPGNRFDEAFQALCSALADGRSPSDLGLPLYGGIYVDEAQDFEAGWLDLLARFLEPGGEMVIVADQRQNLYNRDGGRNGDQSSHRVCRFRGRWAQLGARSYRVPQRTAAFLEAFARQAGLGDDEDLPVVSERQPTLGPVEHEIHGWVRADNNQHALALLEPAIRSFGPVHPSDVCVLVPNHAWGLDAYRALKNRFGPIVHVFSADRMERQKRKKAFWKGRGELKMCTIHSFKGWQIQNVVLLWPSPLVGDAMTDALRHRMLYCAVSRALRNLVIVNADRSYDDLLRIGGHLEELRVDSVGATAEGI
ncbi:MAG: NERD domain-containing protein [Fimbriimonadales bacterium]